jgi:ELWxxDGT repeat protein
MKHLLILGSIVLLLPSVAGAQTATLVRDLNQEEQNTTTQFGNVSDVASVPGRVFFSASGWGGNSEMWTSDGTAEGTFPLKDVCPGPCDSEPRVLGTLNGILLWAGKSDDGWFYLWRSDGTRPGTFRLVEEPLRIEGDDSYGRSPVASPAGGFLYLVSSTGSLDTLWRTDGTRAGTQAILSFDAGQAVEALLAGAGKTFFIVRLYPGSGDPTWSVWTTDGTAPGTRPVKALDRIRPRKPQVAGGRLFFAAQNGASGYELWASDGTQAGTRAVTDFVPQQPFGDPQYSDFFFRAWVSGGHLFFVADDVVHGDELYESDGTVAGTRRITDFGTPEPGFGSVADLGSLTVFTADDDLGHSGVWTTDGDPANTRFLPLPCGSDCWDEIRAFVKVGPRVVLLVQANYGIKILSTDGTPAGTRLLRDGCPDDCDVVLPQNLPAEAAAVPFATLFPDALWITDGTPEGTRKRGSLPGGAIDTERYHEISAGSFTMVFAEYRGFTALWALGPGRGEPRLVTASGANGPGSFVSNLTAFQNKLAFTACDGAAFSLWRSAGTEPSTQPAVELFLSPFGDCDSRVSSGDMASLGTSLVFLQEEYPSRDKALWRSDGTPGGTLRLTPEGLEVFGQLAVGSGRVYFTALRDQAVVSVWTSDGTPAGTVQLASWPAEGKIPSSLAAVGNELYFYFGDYVMQLWKSDGTPQGTKKVFDNGGVSNRPASFTRVGSAVYFVSRGAGFAEEVWRTDGTAAGTQALGAVAGMDRDPYPSELFAFQGSLYFFAWVENDVRGLWRSDGTPAGTVLLARFPEVGSPAYPIEHQLTIAGGKLFFVANDGQHGAELWVTDGTPAGTRRVRDISPGAGASKPGHLTAAGGRLFFSAAEETYGRELWVSDGTEAGTRHVQDIAPFGASSEPQDLTVAGDRLYFTADDGVSGRELWSLPLSGPAGCQPSSTRLCLNGGRYQVEAAWRVESLNGHGKAVPLSGDTGYFWFFEPANVEAVVKVLDGQGVNGHVWVFYGALSDVDYTITVTDTQTGATRRYHNPQGQLASVGDTRGFGPLGAYSASPETIETPPSPRPWITERAGEAATAPCQPGARRLCLNDNRFAVEVAWKDFQGHTGKGTAVPLTSDTGTFWFFDSANVELVLKVLDGRPVNNKFWVFYGALSNVEYTVTVTDTQTGKVRTYKNPSGRFASVADTSAF